MPLRLIGGFDQRWRDTPVKTAAACSCSLALYSSLSLSPFLPSIAPSISSFYTSSSLICPTFSLPALSILIHPLCLYLSCKHIQYILKGQSSHLVSTMLQLIPAPQVVAQSCPQEVVALDRWPIVLPDTHHTHETGSINKHTAHTKACTCV